MRLHRIRLRDFRGVHDREITLAEHGVTVLQGDNEVGKTSTLAALDLLFDAADSSRRAEIRHAQPAGVDAGPEVEAEVSTGPYRFVYRKRWLRRPSTELSVLEPARQQFTGAEAHARVTAMLDETMDRVLWRTLRVEQHTAVGQADLGGQDALTRALDRAASGPTGATGSTARPDPSVDDGLVARAADELRRYRTPSGRATGELRAAEVRRADAEAEHERCRAALEAVERDVAARDRLDAELAGVRARRRAHGDEVAELEDRWAALQSRLREVDAARGRAVLARERAEAARERREARDALVAAAEADAAAAETAAAAVAAHEAEHAAAHDERDARRGADTAARADAVAARRAADAAARAVTAARDRAELADLTERLRRVAEAQAGLDAAERVLADTTVDEDALAELEHLARDLLRAEAARDAAAARVELTAPAPLTVVVDGEEVPLGPGETRTLPVAGARALSVPGVLDVRVRPGLDEAGRDDAVRERARELADACEERGVADLEAARAALRAADDAARRVEEHRAALARELVGHDHAAALRAAHDAVRRRLDDAPAGQDDLAALHTAADEALAAAEEAANRAEEADAACRTAEDAVRKADTRAAVLAERAADARHAHTRRVEELRAARAEEPDAALATAEHERLTRAREAEREHEALAAALAGDDPDTVEARVVNARAVAERLAGEVARLEREHAETTGRLQAAGHQGWHDQLAAAEAELDAAVREHEAVTRRSSAARRLHESLTRHRDRVRRSYVAPFRAQVERLARIVFGPTLSLEIDEDLRITHRTLDGTTVAFGALSSGAQEQLGLCARLACAALVDPADGVPVVIDDALGHTDPERLARLGAVFTAATAAAGAAQVVVLTCTPERYHGIGAATVVPLAPSRRPRERGASDRAAPVHVADDVPAATPGTVLDLPRAPRAG
ncbi:ATP-binding protein [Actinomycetospora cinnamomea]|uniref:DNA repair exonuclease SbcCD ATPase subunit n=1 Tax=Actinomycetospora cinnamomea TaxID=663609 RepID=A0A2U1F102_9PSEU|nr:AAA family ATPase [Actinomycetospora cinnamomea]PVZ05809.1 DNA repair exonuclease SbcCD ATPase subunit [Actinomycetospora cinnamomea]